VVKRKLIQRFSDSIQKRRFCKFGKKRRFVLLFAWETLLPTIGFFPVTWQTFAMTRLLNCEKDKLYQAKGFLG
jgi:hypothetical protein